MLVHSLPVLSTDELTNQPGNQAGVTLVDRWSLTLTLSLTTLTRVEGIQVQRGIPNLS